MNWYSAYEKPIAAASDVVIAFDPWRSCVECGTWRLIDRGQVRLTVDRKIALVPR